MDVLVHLASRQGEVVSRSELEQVVWHGAVIGYDAVTNTVIKLRKALGDSARNPSFIATVPKRGYQLIAPVAAAFSSEGPGKATGDPGASPHPSALRGRTDRAKVALLVVILAAVAAVIWVILTRLTPAPSPDPPPATQTLTRPLGQPPSIIVLPFENLSEDPLQERFADGMTEDLITDLSGLANLLVIASNTAFFYKGQRVQARQLGTDLHVDFVLAGNVRRRGDSLRVNAQLVDTRSAFQVWAERFDRPTSETFAVQDELTNRIVEALAVRLSEQERQRLARQSTTSLAAYDHFLEGQRLSHSGTRESNEQAQAAYRRAIAADPGYGRAYGALAYTLAFSFRRGWNAAPLETADRALELAQRAVELDDSIPQTHWSLGFVRLMRREYQQAERAVEQALLLAPNYADGYGLLALIKNAVGDAPAAIALIEKGMQLNPFYTWDYPYNLGRAYYTLGQIDAAISALEAARARNENAVPVRLHLAAAYARAGRVDDAQWEVEEVQVLSPTDTISHLRATHPIGDPELMRELVEDLRKAGLPE